MVLESIEINILKIWKRKFVLFTDFFRLYRLNFSSCLLIEKRLIDDKR